MYNYTSLVPGGKPTTAGLEIWCVLFVKGFKLMVERAVHDLCKERREGGRDLKHRGQEYAHR